MKKFCRSLRAFVLDILFPIKCFNCQCEGAYLCEQCFRELKFNDVKYLKRARANLKTPNLEEVIIAGDFESSILHNLIIKYKYNFISALGKTLARFLILFWQNKILIQDPNQTKSCFTLPHYPHLLIIPIPLSKKRQRWRGFNQAEIIAQEFSAYFNYELSLNLKRLKHKNPQAALNEAERLENIKSVFAWQGENLNNFTIILIDDVITTGATLNEAARVLKEAGAKKIYGLVLAKG
jgi:ComF family protein